ncbi:MAG TPA: efflux RND transporter periplasmic adaptor subunit [Pirellulales bacterium]|jgi:RND family efflux transporter MFP subunit|nr:efflux RND transporter periplasmic adaptor subunit [Pirellulales bacterium]
MHFVSTRRFNSITSAMLLAGFMLVAGCDRLQPQPPPAAPPPKPPEVIYGLPTTAEVVDYEDFTGRTVAIPTIDIRARVTGYLEKINFKEKEGEDVPKDYVLFEIDARLYKAEVLRAEANLHQAQAHLDRLKLDHVRASKLIDSKSISREQFDLVNGDKSEAEASVEMARANLALARLNLSYTQVKAPIAGRVSRTQLDPGNLVRADETILTTIVSINPIFAYFEVDERTMLRIRRYTEEGRIKSHGDHGVPVQMGLADEEGFPHSGTINFFDNRLDTATGTLQVRGLFQNPNGVLAPGLFARVRLPIGEPYRAVLVSEQALGTDQGQKFLYVIDKDNKAQYRRVQVGKLQKGQRVVLDGLSEGERVVISGLQRIRPGSVVQPKQAESTAQESSVPTPTVAEAPGAGKQASQH